MHVKALKASEKNLPNITDDIRYLAHYFEERKELYIIHKTKKGWLFS